jgi:hypothetical protein
MSTVFPVRFASYLIAAADRWLPRLVAPNVGFFNSADSGLYKS